MGFGSFSDEPFCHVFVDCKPRAEPSYVYVVAADSFQEVSKYQWVSHVPVPILEVLEFQPGELGDYWRVASPEEAVSFKKRQGLVKEGV